MTWSLLVATSLLVHLCCRVVWVLKELEPENWVHNGGTDFAVQLKPPSAADVLGKVLTAEGTYTHWSLFNRFILANEMLDAADSAGRQWCNIACQHHSSLLVRPPHWHFPSSTACCHLESRHLPFHKQHTGWSRRSYTFREQWQACCAVLSRTIPHITEHSVKHFSAQ